MKSRQNINKPKRYRSAVLTIIFLLLGLIIGFTVNTFLNGKNSGFQTSQSSTATMVKNLEKVDQHVFLNVGIQDIETRQNNLKIPWTKIGVPLTEKKAIIILNYDAKLGIKKPVTINYDEQNKKLAIMVPKFDVIGVDLDAKNPYQLYDSRGNILSATTKNVDTGRLVSQALSNDKQAHYLKTYTTMIQESARDYYTTLFTSTAKDLSVTVNFE
ncbi:phosphoribosylglycinamide synthetase [Weissella diestrammenae]|uniref:Phosphoribosylglycinamide synthetase n=1 Tax=Weissella diestrammenae TaxID=1162633 RepID=A0A7G9T590_9LACO|nr:phosphoribosylglycinamide synthetase [Weissella diestrammenae]MCM0583121.1 phosphoribosylglycinamide synthetase [Weissella diestrammenae]QNN75265.1 phosphoribosylglycinamide synthetase [Weissella diestrammenae]